MILHKSWLAPTVRVGVALVIAFLLTQVPMEYLEAWTYDLRVKTKALTPPSGKLVLIAIDPLTIEGLKRDPNAMDHVRLLNALKMSRPRAVVYVQSPNDLDGSSEDLKAFAQAAKNLDHFFVVANQIPMRGQEDQLKLEPPLQSLKVVPGPKTSDLTSFAKDDVTRRMIVSYHGLPTVHALLADSIYGKDDEDKGAINHYRGLFEFFGTGQSYIDFRPSGTYKPLSFIKILQGAYSPDQFHDKIIFVGTDTIMSSSDYIRTPFSRTVVAMSTLEMHANMTDTLIKNSSPQKTSVWLDSLLTGLISVLTVFVVLTARPAKGLLILVTTFSIFSLVCYLAFNFFGYWVAMAHPMLTLFVCYYFFIPYRLIMENRMSWEYFQRNQLLTQVEELKSNFLRMMSHDLKTPLARIQGMTEMVKSDSNPLSLKQREAVDRIHQSSKELSDFISSILSLGRIESKEIKLQLKSKDINTLLSEVIQQCEYLAGTKNIEIMTEFEPLFSIKIDEDLLRQVFTNLIENAIKYSLDNSRILVSTEEVDETLIIQVADHGIGIPDEALPHVFSKFYRSLEVKNSSVKGSGLGLYLAKYFVELHQGTLSVESEIDKGSTFTVKLPMVLESDGSLPI